MSIPCTGDSDCPFCAALWDVETSERYFVNAILWQYEWEEDYGWREVGRTLMMNLSKEQVERLKWEERI